jgi:hypothetical protein
MNEFGKYAAMSIRFRCKKCNQKYELEDDCAGDTIDCTRCNTPMLVPQQSEIPPGTSCPKDALLTDSSKDTTPGDIILYCKICNQKYQLPKSAGGQIAECSKCKNEMLIPLQSENAPEKVTPKENVILWCKSCGQKLCLSKELAGQTGECTKCRKVFEIPAESEAKLSGILSLLKKEVSEKKGVPAKILSKKPASE